MIKTLYQMLVEEFGRLKWWPADTDFEVIVGAVLTQQTRWDNVEKVIARLKGAGLMSPEAMSNVPVAELEMIVKPAGFYRQKARRIRHIAEYFGRNPMEEVFMLPDKVLRSEMLKLPGIGNETADCILLYAAGKPSFVIDAYTRRMCRCLGIEGDYHELQEMFEAALPRDLYVYRQYHALIVEHGKRYCLKKKCESCVVSKLKGIF